MYKVLFCLIALAAIASADVRPTNTHKRVKVQRQEDTHVTDMDRMSYEGLFTLEQTAPQELADDIPIADVVRILEASLGSEWRDHVDLDDSQPITYLELLRLSTSISLKQHEIEESTRATRGRGSSSRKSNFCMCHGTSRTYVDDLNAIPDARTNTNGKSHPFKGVRIHGKGAGHIYQSGVTGHNSNKNGGGDGVPYDVPRDCELCWGEVNCNKCCNGPCTAGTPADFQEAVINFDDSQYWGARGLYQCPGRLDSNGPRAGTQYEWKTTSENINDISACTWEPTTCGEAVELCNCAERLSFLRYFECNCQQVLDFCTSCYQAWDAIDVYKHCDCEDYALYYSRDVTPDFGEFPL